MTSTTTESTASTSPARAIESRVQSLMGAVLSRGFSYRSRPFFALMRRYRPILRSGPYTMVACDADVREVLSRSPEFSVGLYGVKMEEVAGPFILGIDDETQHEHDHLALRRAMRADDLPRIDAVTTRVADALVVGAERHGRIDVVGGLADQVVTTTVGEYFGTPGPDPATLLAWARVLFQEIFFNVANDPRISREAHAAAADMRSYLDRLIALRKEAMRSGRSSPDDVVARLLRAQEGDPPFLDDTAIRTNLLGLLIGWIPLMSKSAALAVLELLGRPTELKGAQHAAREGDDELVAKYVFEALRFRPPSVGLLRKCLVDTTVAAGSRRQATITAGATVFALTQSAMMDPLTIDRPERFLLDRPWGEYLHWGYGMHTCFGEAIARRQVPLIAKALLRRGPVARAAGSAGRLRWKGPFPVRLNVSIGTTSAGDAP